MKKKIKKEYIKTNLIGFIIAGIIVSGGFVFAAVTFPSNEVSYSNGTSGLKSTDVQGAIDELYETCTRLPAGVQIIENAGLQKDSYECRYFFTGANPNNYITFNNETWRIVSVECDGTIKIMRNASIGNQYWDTSGSNNWARPATLNTYLNNTYYNNLTVTAQSQIVAKDFSIGAVTWYSNDMNEQVKEENSKKWHGKIALLTASEYIRTNSNKSNCGTFNLYNRNYISCFNTGWMKSLSVDGFWWTLSLEDNYVLHIDATSGYINGEGVVSFDSLMVIPVIYLSSDIKITGGTGAESSPYEISM